jgi:hypothetical protein
MQKPEWIVEVQLAGRMQAEWEKAILKHSGSFPYRDPSLGLYLLIVYTIALGVAHHWGWQQQGHSSMQSSWSRKWEKWSYVRLYYLKTHTFDLDIGFLDLKVNALGVVCGKSHIQSHIQI